MIVLHIDKIKRHRQLLLFLVVSVCILLLISTILLQTTECESLKSVHTKLFPNLLSAVAAIEYCFNGQNISNYQNMTGVSDIKNFSEIQNISTSYLQKILVNKAAANLDGTYLIITTGNSGFGDFVLNFVEGMRRVNRTKFLILCFDTSLYERLETFDSALETHLVLVPPLWLENKNLTSDVAHWQSQAYNSLTLAKTQTVNALLLLGYTVVLNDADVVWLSSDVLGYLDAMLTPYINLLIMQDDEYTMNTGFYVAKPTKRVKELFSESIRRQKEEPERNDQIIMNIIMNEQRLLLEGWMLQLDPVLFSAGKYALEHLKDPVRPLVVHANYVEKRKLLRAVGGWFLNSSSQNLRNA